MSSVHLALKREGKERRLASRAKQKTAALIPPARDADASARYHHEAEQRRRVGVKHGGSAKDIVADALRAADSVEHIDALIRQHAPRLTALHASCSLGRLLELLQQRPDPPPLRKTVDSILAITDACLVKTGRKLSAVSLPAVVYRHSKLKHYNAQVLPCLCLRARQVLPELEPAQVARLTWGLGRQHMLAAAAASDVASSAGEATGTGSSAAVAGAQQAVPGAGREQHTSTSSAAADASKRVDKDSGRLPEPASAAQSPTVTGGDSNDPQHITAGNSSKKLREVPVAASCKASSSKAAAAEGEGASRAGRVTNATSGSRPSGCSCISGLLPQLLERLWEELPSMNLNDLAAAAEGLTALGPTVLERAPMVDWLQAVLRELPSASRTKQSREVDKVLTLLQQLLQQQGQQGQPQQDSPQQSRRGHRKTQCQRDAGLASDGSNGTELDELFAAVIGAAKQAGFEIKQLQE